MHKMDFGLMQLKGLTVLFIEDDPVMLRHMIETLNVFFGNVLAAQNAKEGFRLYEEERPDIILCDIGLPDMDGFSLVNKIRLTDSTTPIVFLSSFSDQAKLLEAANAGINGYIVKPVELQHLLNTLLKALKRSGINIQNVVSFKDGLMFNVATKELYRHGRRIELGAKEEKVLTFFILNGNRTLSKEEIVSYIWPLEEMTDSALKNLLNRLRKKIGAEIIISVKGSGWRLNTAA